MLIHSRLDLEPQPKDRRVKSRQNLRAHHASDIVLAVRPPVQIRQPGPKRSLGRPARRRAGAAQHERQAPALRRVSGNGVQVPGRVRQMRLRCCDALPPEVGELRDLVREHLLYGGFLEDLDAGLGAGAVVEEDC